MENITIQALISKYLTWCVKHRSPRSCEWYKGHFKGFLSFPGIAELPAATIKPYHVHEWVDSHENWGSTYTRGAIVAVQRLYNWAVEQGHLESTPLAKMKKPSPKHRETFLTATEFADLLKHLRAKDPFRRFLVFCWLTGARPQEVRAIEPRHVDMANERIVFPVEESKGKRAKRIIYIQGDALKIIQRLMLHRKDEGKLFRNKRGKEWTKFAVCNRMHRLTKTLGKHVFAYALRHSFATRKLVQGIDSITVAKLMGHADTQMLNRVYAHIDKDTDHLKRALAN